MVNVLKWLKGKPKTDQKTGTNCMHGSMKCWEFKKCGREKNGGHIGEFGICPAYPNHGRFCWTVAGTLCDMKVQGTFASKKMHCVECDFYKKVSKEEGNDFTFVDIDDEDTA